MNNNDGSFAVVEYHVSDIYQLPWGINRGTFYNIWSVGIPWLEYDGTGRVWPIIIYEDEFANRQAVTTDVTLQVSGEHIEGDTYRATAQVCIEPGGAGKTMRIYMVQVLDNWPIPPTYSRNTFKQAADTVDIVLAPGECQSVSSDFTLDADSLNQVDDVKIIVWAQEPNAAAPAEVFQAGKMSWPFAGPALPPGDLDGSGTTDIDDVPAFVLALIDRAAYEIAYPGVNPDEVGDFNGDNLLNGADLQGFVSLLAPPPVLPLGDMNGSGTADTDDVPAFVLALIDRAAYEQDYPGVNADEVGDFDGDGVCGSADIQGCVALLTGL